MLDIQPKYITLHELTQNRLFRIPDYQRSYSWTRKQREDLFDDIWAAYDKGNDRAHFMATVVGLQVESMTIRTTKHSVIDIVDGQQRITTLILLLKTIARYADNGDTEEEDVRKEIEGILVKDDNATLLLLQTNHDTSDYFKRYMREGIHAKSSEAKTVADREILSAIEDCEEFVEDWIEDGHSLIDLVSLLKNRLTFVFHEIGDEALVYTVFEVLNSRGLEVSWFDRLKSMLMATIFESDTDNKREFINEVHQGWADLYGLVRLNLGVRNISMRFAATLWNNSRPSKVLGSEDAALELLRSANGEPQGVLEATAWLKDVTAQVDEMISDLRRRGITHIIHANLVAIAIQLRSDLSTSERAELLREWEGITFKIYGLNRNDARTGVGDNVRLAWDITRQISIEDIRERFFAASRYFPIAEKPQHINVDWYSYWGEQLLYFCRRYEEHLAAKNGQHFDNEQWNRIWAKSAAASIEHIRPQSEGSKHMHSLGNLMLLPPGLNSQLQNKPVREKAEAYRKTGLLMAQEVADLVGYYSIKSHWTNEAIQAREEALWEWARQEWGD